MKIQIISDLHMEFRDPPLIANQGSDVLILGGDICVAQHLYRHPLPMHVPNNAEHGELAQRYRMFLQHVNLNWRKVIYVAGNHEHYHGRWDRTIDVLRANMQCYPNIEVCDQNKVVVDDVVFLGVSLWTDFNNRDPLTLQVVRSGMNDYRTITECQHRPGEDSIYHRLRPTTTLAKHIGDVAWLRQQLTQDLRKTVVVSHHCPSHSSIAPQYREPQHHAMNGAFASNLDDVIIDHHHMVLWTHGHTHTSMDYEIGSTRVICNPYGYHGEHTGFDPELIVDI